MRQYWSIFFGLCATRVFAALSDNFANNPAGVAETDQSPGASIDNGREEHQHPITIVYKAAVEQKCAVCEGISAMINTPIEEPFRATIGVQPSSPEAACKVHAPLRPPEERESDPDEPEKFENIHLGKRPHDPRLGIYFGSLKRGISFELLQKQVDVETNSHRRRVRLVDPEWIDLSILKEWANTCTHKHGETCESSPFAAGYDLKRPAYLIDAVEGRLVDTSSITDTSLQYITLSHPRETHGNRSYLFATTENIAQLQEPGSLLSPTFATDMPPTFRDAIELASLLEYRYIWIPPLCIIQDDPTSRAAETAKVGDILVGAAFSISQLCDLDAMRGIRGIRELANPQPRSLVQHLYQWGDETLIVPVSQHVYDYQRRALNQGGHGVGQSPWTLEEAFLPRRQIRFGLDSVEWRCRSCSIWEETSPACDQNYNRLRSPDSVLLDPFGLGGQNGPEKYRAHWTDAFSLPWFSVDHYFQALRQLTELDKSAGGDTLDTAAGMISRLGFHSQCSILCGMPEERLDIALLFSVGMDGSRGPHRRDVGPPSHPDRPWPSWSWAGWTGAVLIDPAMKGSDHIEPNSEVDIISIVDWYASDSPSPDAPRRRLKTRLWDDAKQRFQHSNLEPVPAGWARESLGSMMAIYPGPKSRNYGRPDFDRNVMYTHKSFPSLQFAYPIPMRETTQKSATSALYTRMTTERYLSGMVDRIFLYIRSIDYISHYLNQPYKLYCEKGQHVGVLQSTGGDDLSLLLGLPASGRGLSTFNFRVNETQEDPGDSKARLEVIALSRMYARWGSNLPDVMSDGETRYHSDKYYEFYNVMWIEWTDGVAYRKGIGRVLAEFWENLQPESISLVLG